LFLKVSTAVTVKIGPFVDDGDGNTEENALTLTQADIRLSKNGGNIAQKHEATNATIDELGYYDCPIDVTDTDTLGRLQLMVHEAGALPVYHEFTVVTANVWDTLCGATHFLTDLSAASEGQIDAIETDTNELQTDLHDGGRLDLILDSIVTSAATAGAYAIVNSGLGFRGTVTNIPGANQFKIATLVGVGAGAFVDAVNPWFAYVFRDAGGASGAPQGEYRQVTGYNSATGQFTTLAFTAPGVELGDDVVITRNMLANVIDIKAVTDTLSLAAIADAVHDEAVEGAYTLREAVKLVLAACAGKLSGAGTGTLTFRDVNDGADRIVATVDANNNRTGVALTV
jgi:hypothetical protein